MKELQNGINGRVSRRSQGGGKPHLHGWAFHSYIVGLTLAVNLWALIRLLHKVLPHHLFACSSSTSQNGRGYS